ncbi:MAG: N-acetylglucosamine-6-phosphate deacetylase [Vicinamibacterales bacterium]|nr:N-acetylglucosamine-6-phosphate deacetylase [Vicinamibacterales bacterium]
MIVIKGGDLVLPDGVLQGGTLVLDGERIGEMLEDGQAVPSTSDLVEAKDHLVVPGFIDVHVHGIEGFDTLDGPDAIPGIAARLPKYGVTSFCPTTVACDPRALQMVFGSITSARALRAPSGARVLPAHLESNFINPAYRGAQPEHCLRTPPAPGVPRVPRQGGYDGADILEAIDQAGDAVRIVTLAPELAGSEDLVRHLVARGRRVSLGHSGATLEQGRAAIEAGARQATHLYNRMPSLGHRDPGLVGAVLESDAVAAEIICDGVHVHPAIVRMSVSLKQPERVMAITDATAAAGLVTGSHAKLGGRRVTVAKSASYLDDGTLAGSIATMDRVFRFLVVDVGLSPVAAARLCSTTPADELGLQGFGRIAKGAIADFVVLDRNFTVKHVFIGGGRTYSVR